MNTLQKTFRRIVTGHDANGQAIIISDAEKEHRPLYGFGLADILKGKKLTGYWNIQVDLKNAGGTVLEQLVVTDDNLITSRHSIDVADFSRAVESWLIKK